MAKSTTKKSSKVKAKAKKAVAPESGEDEEVTEAGSLDKVLNPTSVRPNVQAFCDWVEANGGPKIKPEHAQVVITGYKKFQRSPEAVEARESAAAERLEAKEARAAAREEKRKEREAKAAEREERRAEREKNKAAKASKASKKSAAAASKPKKGKAEKATPTARAGKGTTKKKAAKKSAAKAAF